MLHWAEVIRQQETFDDIPLEMDLVNQFQDQSCSHLDDSGNSMAFFTPSFKRYESNEITSCGSAWPAVSITGAECALQCDHCRASVLQPMLAANTPEKLWRLVNNAIETGAKGMLLTGGSSRRNEINYAPFLATIQRIKNTFTDFRIACHTALMRRDDVWAMEQSGVDIAMLDMIGSQDTVSQVYHLRRSVDDFERTLAYLADTSMRVVPHIVLGLHYGRLLGEWQALNMVTGHRFDALVLVVAMPFYAPANRSFKTPDPHAVGRFFLFARQQIARQPLLLGCARPPGTTKSAIDAYAVMAGFNGIAYPADGIIKLAHELGKAVRVTASCCSMLATEQLVNDVVPGPAISQPMLPPSATRPTRIADIPLVVESKDTAACDV